MLLKLQVKNYENALFNTLLVLVFIYVYIFQMIKKKNRQRKSKENQAHNPFVLFISTICWGYDNSSFFQDCYVVNLVVCFLKSAELFTKKKKPISHLVI